MSKRSSAWLPLDAGRCDACDTPLAGMIVAPPDADVEVVCRECIDAGRAEPGAWVYVKGRMPTDRWQP